MSNIELIKMSKGGEQARVDRVMKMTDDQVKNALKSQGYRVGRGNSEAVKASRKSSLIKLLDDTHSRVFA